MNETEMVNVEVKIDISRLNVGDKVRYEPEDFLDGDYQNGMIKEIRQDVLDSVWVVYNCIGDWDNYTKYTSAKTYLRDLKLEWRHDGNAKIEYNSLDF